MLFRGIVQSIEQSGTCCDCLQVGLSMEGILEYRELALGVIAQHIAPKGSKQQLAHLFVEGEDRVLKQQGNWQIVLLPVVQVMQEQQAILGVHAVWGQREEHQE